MNRRIHLAPAAAISAADVFRRVDMGSDSLHGLALPVGCAALENCKRTPVMNWACLRHCAWVDTRAAFVAATPRNSSLLDLGSSDGETLRHIAELRPDLRLHAVDVAGVPENYPPKCDFQRANLERGRLPWPDGSMSAITCMHLVEHLQDAKPLMREAARLLRPGGRIYFETPHPKTLDLPGLRGRSSVTFTMNFFDDPTHVRVVTTGELAESARGAGLEVIQEGVSRNLLFAASHFLYRFLPPSRQKYTAYAHWLGWSACLTARRPL